MNITMKNILISLLLVITPLAFIVGPLQFGTTRCADQVAEADLLAQQQEMENALNEWVSSLEDDVKALFYEAVQAQETFLVLQVEAAEMEEKGVKPSQELLEKIQKAGTSAESALRDFEDACNKMANPKEKI
ncbi:MAG TPA: hypothetical protein VGT41_04035 [Candidatus Babeliales bacterium]|nr:hypothetical protein [Candidatus Babeliales bacterium]